MDGWVCKNVSIPLVDESGIARVDPWLCGKRYKGNSAVQVFPELNRLPHSRILLSAGLARGLSYCNDVSHRYHRHVLSPATQHILLPTALRRLVTSTGLTRHFYTTQPWKVILRSTNFLILSPTLLFPLIIPILLHPIVLYLVCPC